MLYWRVTPTPAVWVNLYFGVRIALAYGKTAGPFNTLGASLIKSLSVRPVEAQLLNFWENAIGPTSILITGNEKKKLSLLATRRAIVAQSNDSRMIFLE